MRSLVFTGPGEMALEEREIGEPTEDELIIRVARVGICGSDIHGFSGHTGRRHAGQVMGHEVAGWVSSAGDQADLRVGQLVTVNPVIACDGECGHTTENQCLQMQVIGVTPNLPGGFAELLRVPATRAVPLPAGTHLDDVACIEPYAVALNTTHRLRLSADDRVAVIGAGMIGICVALAAAKKLPISEIVVSDPIESRREVAATLGFTTADPETIAQQKHLTKVVDAVGRTETIHQSLSLVPPGGEVCVVGLGDKAPSVQLQALVGSERSLIGAFGYSDRTFAEAADDVAHGRVQFRDLVGEVAELNEGPRILHQLSAAERHDVKVLLAPSAPRA